MTFVAPATSAAAADFGRGRPDRRRRFGEDGVGRRQGIPPFEGSGHGQGPDEIEQGSAKAEEGQGEDQRVGAVAEARDRPRPGEFQEVALSKRKRGGTESVAARSCRVRNFFRIAMQTQNIIERAFELARGSNDLDDIRKTLRREGYSNVDAHLAGASIKADLKKQFVRETD
jgi:hypothetical protein